MSVFYAKVWNGTAWVSVHCPAGMLPEVEERVGERSVASFSVIYATATGRTLFRKGRKVELRASTGDTLLFSGVIDQAIGVPAPYKVSMGEWQLTCADNHYYADKRVAVNSYYNASCGSIVASLRTSYLAAEGITAGTIADGPVVSEVRFNYRPVSECLSALAEQAGFVWYIDKNKALHFHARDGVNAPWTPGLADMRAGSIRIQEFDPQYRNRQFIKGGFNVIPRDDWFRGDGSNQTFVCTFPLAKVPTVRVDSAPQTVGIRGVDSPTAYDFYWNKGDPEVTARVAPIAASHVQVVYDGQFAIVAMASDPDEVSDMAARAGGTGYVEAVDDMEPIADSTTPLAVAGQKLSRFGKLGVELSFTTTRSGLAPGQKVTLNIPELGLTSITTFVETVRLAVPLRTTPTYEVTLSEGLLSGSWARLFVEIAEVGMARIESITVGEDAVLLVLAGPTQETWSWAETLTQTPLTCPLPNTTTYPATTRYPC
jgi:hypothetical protein